MPDRGELARMLVTDLRDHPDRPLTQLGGVRAGSCHETDPSKESSLRTRRGESVLAWNEKTWDTPNVAHDNPADQHLHASVILGFADDTPRDGLYADQASELTALLAPHLSAIHAYDAADALTYVRNSEIMPHYEN